VKKLKARLSPEDQARLERGETSNAEAYELRLRGAQFSRQGSTPEEMTKSIDCFERAIALDPNYSAAYIGLAYAYIRYATTHGYRPAHDTYPKAREALLKALEIDEESANAHSGLALYYLNYEWNWPAAERELKRAVELDSEDPGISLDYGTYYDTLGRTDDAIRMRENARRLVPAAGVMLAGLGHSNFAGRRYDEAIKWYSAALELNPRSPWAYHNRGRSYLQIGRIAEGIADVEKAAELFDRSPRSLAALANCYGKAGKTDKASRILAELQQRAASEYVAPFYFALVYAGLNDADQAFAFLEKAREDRQPQLTMLKVEPSFDPIRSDPRFAELVKKVGIPE
jgi:tetratricopeptide (TPR) repeat protein